MEGAQELPQLLKLVPPLLNQKKHRGLQSFDSCLCELYVLGRLGQQRRVGGDGDQES